MTLLKQLNKNFAIDKALVFKSTDNDMIIAEINSSVASASICLQGAHLMHWKPHHQDHPIIWLSDEAKPALSKSIRGGIPICWPWFGAHQDRLDFPSHGHVRTTPWEVTKTDINEMGEITLTLLHKEDEVFYKFWPYKCQLELSICIGSSLSLVLKTTNNDLKDFSISEAIHTYFAISDISQVTVSGLDTHDFYNTLIDAPTFKQQGDISFASETDRVYINSSSSCAINDPGFKRKIVIDKTGSLSTVVWNPWIDKANRLGDLGPDGWKKMLCVESANAFDNIVSISPGCSHELAVNYSVKPL